MAAFAAFGVCKILITTIIVIIVVSGGKKAQNKFAAAGSGAFAYQNMKFHVFSKGYM